MDTQQACINVDHIDENLGDRLLVDAVWHAFCQAICRLVDGKVGLGPVMDRRHLRPYPILAQDPRFSLRLVILVIFCSRGSDRLSHLRTP